MLLVIDIGNTNIVLGLYDGPRLHLRWRLQTNTAKTGDEYGVLIRQLFVSENVQPGDVTGCIVASVVPPMSSLITEMVERYFGIHSMVVGPGIKTGMPIRYENPREVGADRIVNAIAAFERTRRATIVVDFGTATTFDAISGTGDYLGGAICPGVTISADALYRRASKLPRVEIAVPSRVIGRNTVASMQAGIVYGYVCMIDGMVDRMTAEYGEPMAVMATGGLAQLFAEQCRSIDEYDADLTLAGLRIIYERNRS